MFNHNLIFLCAVHCCCSLQPITALGKFLSSFHSSSDPKPSGLSQNNTSLLTTIRFDYKLLSERQNGTHLKEWKIVLYCLRNKLRKSQISLIHIVSHFHKKEFEVSLLVSSILNRCFFFIIIIKEHYRKGAKLSPCSHLDICLSQSMNIEYLLELVFIPRCLHGTLYLH